MIPRADALASLERDSFDLVVVGGGITGAGVALDASSRGSTAAVSRAPQPALSRRQHRSTFSQA